MLCQSYLQPILLRAAVADVERTADEVVLDVHDEKGANGAHDLQKRGERDKENVKKKHDMKISLVFANGNGTFFAKTCKTRKNKSIHPHQPENEKLQLITEGGKYGTMTAKRWNDG